MSTAKAFERPLPQPEILTTRTGRPGRRLRIAADALATSGDRTARDPVPVDPLGRDPSPPPPFRYAPDGSCRPMEHGTSEAGDAPPIR